MSLRTTKENLAAILRNAAATIDGLDSVEGSIGWIEGEPGVFHVYGAYRFGNQLGQGSVRLYGTEENARATAERERERWFKATPVTPAQLVNDETYETWTPGPGDGAIIGEPLAQRLGRLPRYKVWLADEDQLGDLVLRTGAPLVEHGPHDVEFAGTTAIEVAIAAYRRTRSVEPVSFIVKNFDTGRYYDVVVTPAGASSCAEREDHSKGEREPWIEGATRRKALREAFQTHDLAAAFETLVQAARGPVRAVEPMTVAAIAYVAQLAIDVGGHDAAAVRRFEAALVAKVEGR